MTTHELSRYITNIIRMILGGKTISENNYYFIYYDTSSVILKECSKGEGFTKIIKTFNVDDYNYSNLHEVQTYLLTVID